jgi:hypothetical protein
MKPPSPALRDLTRRLIEDEAGRASGFELAAVAEEVFRKLRDQLIRIIGSGGFEALLSRSLKLAKAEASSLAQVEVTPGGGLAGLSTSLAGRSAAEALEASVCLLGCFLELLAAFIGDDLTSHLASATLREDGESQPGSEDR